MEDIILELLPKGLFTLVTREVENNEKVIEKLIPELESYMRERNCIIVLEKGNLKFVYLDEIK